MTHCKTRFRAIADMACLRSILAQKPWKPSKGSNIRNCSPGMVTSWFQWNNLGQNDKQYTINQSINLRCNCQLVFNDWLIDWMEFYAVWAIFQPLLRRQLVFKVRIKNPYITKFTIFFSRSLFAPDAPFPEGTVPRSPPPLTFPGWPQKRFVSLKRSSRDKKSSRMKKLHVSGE